MRRRVPPRRLVQVGVLLLILVGVFVVRGNAERFCPFGGVETLWAYAVGGNVLCSLGVSSLFLLAGLLVSVLFLRRAFCSHACPIGTVSEFMRGAGRKLGLGAGRIPPRVDAALSLLKYAVLAFIIFVTWQASELLFRAACPAYALLGRHGEDITMWAYVVAGAILLGSLFTALPFCRWLCPLAAVMNPISKFGFARIIRDEGACIDCGKCARACPMGIPVHEVPEVKAARCTSCLECVSSCPTRGRRTLAFGLPGGRRRLFSASALATAFVLIIAAAVTASALFPLPSFRWSHGDTAAATAVLEIEVEDLTCRGRATMFTYFLGRDDDLAIEGPLRLEAWPGPGAARARIYYDPTQTDPAVIQAALTNPYYDYDLQWRRDTPFRILGYDPLAGP